MYHLETWCLRVLDFLNKKLVMMFNFFDIIKLNNMVMKKTNSLKYYLHRKMEGHETFAFFLGLQHHKYVKTQILPSILQLLFVFHKGEAWMVHVLFCNAFISVLRLHVSVSSQV